MRSQNIFFRYLANGYPAKKFYSTFYGVSQKCHIYRLLEALQIRECYICCQRSFVTGMEAFVILLRRLTYPNRWCDLKAMFGRGSWRGGTSPISQPIFFRNPTSQCSNPIPTSRIWKKSQCYTYHLFSLRIRKITASKYDPTKTQKFTRIYKDVLEITGSFQTVIKLSSSEFIAISPCHFTFLPFLPAGNLPSDL